MLSADAVLAMVPHPWPRAMMSRGSDNPFPASNDKRTLRNPLLLSLTAGAGNLRAAAGN